jgi:excisionase family DNA binding protein
VDKKKPRNAPEPRQLGKVEDAQRILALSRAAVYKLMDNGELEWVKIGRSRRIPLDAIQALIERNLVAG